MERQCSITLYIFPPAPEDVQSPTAVSFPTFLLMSWSPPKTPNGIITQYTLYMNGIPIYSGNGTKYVVKGEFSAR